MYNYPLCNLSEDEQERMTRILWEEFSSADVECDKMSYNRLCQTMQNHSLDIAKYLHSVDEIIDFAFECLKITLTAIFFKTLEEEVLGEKTDFFADLLSFHNCLTNHRLRNPSSIVSYWLLCLDIKKDITFFSIFGKSCFIESRKILSDIFSQIIIDTLSGPIQSNTSVSNVSSLCSLCILKALSQDTKYPENSTAHRLSFEFELDIIKRGTLYR